MDDNHKNIVNNALKSLDEIRKKMGKYKNDESLKKKEQLLSSIIDNIKKCDNSIKMIDDDIDSLSDDEPMKINDTADKSKNDFVINILNDEIKTNNKIKFGDVSADVLVNSININKKPINLDDELINLDDENVKSIDEIKINNKIKFEDMENVTTVYSALTKISSSDILSKKKFIKINKNHVYTLNQFCVENNTMLQLSIGQRNDITLEILKNKYCTEDYLYHVNDNGLDAIKLIIQNNTDMFLHILTNIDTLNCSVKNVLYGNLHRYLFYLLNNGKYFMTTKYINTFMTDKNRTQLKPHCKLTQIVDINDKYTGYSFLSYILEMMNEKSQYKKILNNIIQASWFNENIIKYIIDVYIKDKFYSSIIILNSVLPDKYKKSIGKIILLNSEYMNIKCLLNFAIESLLQYSDLADISGYNRIHFMIKHGDIMILKRLLTSRCFTNKEYHKLDNMNRNCILHALISKPEFIPILISSDFFTVKMLKETDIDGNGILYYTTTFNPHHEQVRNLLSMYFPEPDKVSEDFEGDIMCKICLHNKVNIRISPCAHTICSKCISCLKKAECPFCSNNIQSYQLVRFS
jgi:hypothetical protein